MSGPGTYVPQIAAVAAAAAGLVRWYVVDRRKSKAEARLTEDTLDSEIDVHDTGARDARLLYVQKQMDMERAFHAHQVADRDAEIARQRAELGHRDDIIASLLRDIDRLEAQLAQVSREMTAVRSQLSDLATHQRKPK